MRTEVALDWRPERGEGSSPERSCGPTARPREVRKGPGPRKGTPTGGSLSSQQGGRGRAEVRMETPRAGSAQAPMPWPLSKVQRLTQSGASPSVFCLKRRDDVKHARRCRERCRQSHMGLTSLGDEPPLLPVSFKPHLKLPHPEQIPMQTVGMTDCLPPTADAAGIPSK